MKNRYFGTLLFSFCLCLLLAMIPLPVVLNRLRPQWVLLWVIGWNLALPQRFSLGVSFSVGVMMDFLSGVSLGTHALPYVCVSYLIARFYQRIRVFPFLQKLLVITSFIGLYQILFFLLSPQGKTMFYAGVLLLSFCATTLIVPFALRIVNFYYDSDIYSD
jgi:rod shape-determining protein MreD